MGNDTLQVYQLIQPLNIEQGKPYKRLPLPPPFSI